jgi:uncharacterized protein YegP (UPF0339 family)
MSVKYEYYLDHNAEWRWTARAANGEPVADSAEGYKNLWDCLHGIELVKGSANARVVPRPTVLSELARQIVEESEPPPRNRLADILLRR